MASRKLYVEVAEMLHNQAAYSDYEIEREQVSRITLELASIFKRNNPRFQASHFFDAAGFPELTATRQGLN